MIEWFKSVFEIVQPFLPWMVSLSLLMALASMIAIPLLVVRMPADYFTAKKRPRRWTGPRIVLYVVRNVIAVVLLVAGIAMLILPGQGLLTILIAIITSDVPGKYDVERWIVRQRGVLRALNWIRSRYKKPQLEKPLERSE
ncbi:hypothetical protein [Aliidiomarina indica]|uniref:hypothetical protein n=1 Tax=Aliidiomarina indica TaxID=2749147 RepID=UPI00188F9686|nr:hypothetical protein [Aliidiomarina indica]